MVLQDIIHHINKSSGLVNYLEQLEKSSQVVKDIGYSLRKR